MEKIRIMNFCGTHEYVTVRYGLRHLMPTDLELVAGPGCPVCITPGFYVDALIEASLTGTATIIVFGDALKLPGTSLRRPRSLYDAKAMGGKIHVAYSFMDAVKMAAENPGENFVFFAIGFETTQPSVTIPLSARKAPLNLKIMSSFRYTPPVVKYLLDKHRDEVNIHGIIAPGHVSTIIGSDAWRFIPQDYGVPTVISGFEPVDLLISIYHIVKMLKSGKPGLVNEYTRAVKPDGSLTALSSMRRVLKITEGYWRGIGIVPESAGELSERYSEWDAVKALNLKVVPRDDKLPACKCDKVILGLAIPLECPLFKKACTPDNPYGPCMVSYEGTCRIWAENLVYLQRDGDDQQGSNT